MFSTYITNGQFQHHFSTEDVRSFVFYIILHFFGVCAPTQIDPKIIWSWRLNFPFFPTFRFFLMEKKGHSIWILRMQFCIEERRAGWLGEEGEIFWVLRAMISVNRAIPLPLSSCGLDNLSLPCQHGMVPPDKKSLRHILAYPDFWFTVVCCQTRWNLCIFHHPDNKEISQSNVLGS